MTVGLLVVSHSSKIASGVCELAQQMAASITMVAAGGTDDDGIGTSFDRVQAGLTEADSGDGVVVLYDLGSALMTAESAVEFLEDDAARERVRIVDAPLVEGAVAAAVAAEMGGDVGTVAAAARTATGGEASGETSDGPSVGTSGGTSVAASGGSSVAASDGGAPEGSVERTVVLVNRDGLHARPAADFVKLAGSFDARIAVNGVDAQSLLAVMSLGLLRGTQARISASGAEAQRAVDELSALIESGFGED